MSNAKTAALDLYTYLISARAALETNELAEAADLMAKVNTICEEDLELDRNAYTSGPLAEVNYNDLVSLEDAIGEMRVRGYNYGNVSYFAVPAMVAVLNANAKAVGNYLTT